MLNRSGVPVTHLRPTLFTEWSTYFAPAIRAKSLLPLPFGEARYAPISGEDIGRAVAAILTAPAEHAGKVYPLFGPTEISQADTAEIISKVVGRKITYAALAIESFGQVLKDLGFTDHFIQHISAVAQDCRDGVCSGTNDTIKQLTGREPMSMTEYVEKNKALFA
jgi:NAD(P)H dehydrogenase (quinone)